MEIVTEVAFQCRFKPTNDHVGSGPLVWDAQASDWTFRTGASNHDWSESVFACGGKALGRDGAVIIDARESVITDGPTKAASMVNVGEAAFKGLVGPDTPIDCEQDLTTYSPEERSEQAEAALRP